jgi:subtilisin family serine protease
MGHGQTRLVERLLAVHEQVEIDRPRPVVRPLAGASEQPFELKEEVEQLARRQLGFHLDGRVQEGGLVEEAPWLGLANRGDGAYVDPLAQQLDRVTEHRLAVAEVRTQADIGACHNANLTEALHPSAPRGVELHDVLAALLAAALAIAAPAAPARPGATLVQLTERGACADAVAVVRAGGTVVAPELRVYRLPEAAPSRLVSSLRADAALQTLERDRPSGRLLATTADDPLVAEEWWRDMVGIQGLTPPGPGKPVTVVDSGISSAHPEFTGRANLELLNPQEPAPLGGEHGTMVSSLVGAPVNGVGMVGIYPDAVLREWDAALGEGRALATSDIVAGIVAAARRGPGVINLSLGGPDRDSLVEQAVGLAMRSGSLVVAAAGNEGRDGVAGYPAALPHVLTVGATTRNGAVAGFSTPSRYVDLAAPGADMLVASAQSNSWQSGASGTSFSAPLVSGAAAWVWTARPELDNTQLFEVMRRSSRDIPPAGKDNVSGFGELDVGRALTWPAPIPDPREPNDDMEFVRPSGFFATGTAPLTTTSRTRSSLAARLDSVEDPRDLYRVWLPARRSVRVTVRSAVDVNLAVWKQGTFTVEQPPRGARLAVSARAGTGNEGLVVKAAPQGRWAYVAVTPGRSVPGAEYRLSVAAS